uniref:Testis development related protein n=1 Tax=Sinocyclocheilus anshuiensis TaxID=1608454 RepID=A0A671RNS7_9TELE
MFLEQQIKMMLKIHGVNFLVVQTFFHFTINDAASFSLRSAKKNWEDDKSKAHSEKDKAHCLWDSITMTMKQITPTRKIDKIEGWEPPQSDSSTLSLSLPHSLGLPSWVGLGSEEDSSRYASLTESQTGGPSQWAARARDKLAAVRRRSPAGLSERNWEGLK